MLGLRIQFGGEFLRVPCQVNVELNLRSQKSKNIVHDGRDHVVVVVLLLVVCGCSSSCSTSSSSGRSSLRSLACNYAQVLWEMFLSSTEVSMEASDVDKSLNLLVSLTPI